MLSVKQVNADSYHRTVANHSLNINSQHFHKYVAGIDHYAGSGKDGVGSKISRAGIVKLALFRKSRQKTYVHRSRAKLEGKGVPTISKLYSAVSNRKAENDLLIYLKRNNEKRGKKDHQTHSFGLVLFVEHAKQNGCKDSKTQAHKVIPAVERRLLYLELQKS